MKKHCLLLLIILLTILYCPQALAWQDPSAYSHTCKYTIPAQILVKPDCRTTGIQRMRCSYQGCSRSIQVSLPKVGHDMGGWVTDHQPTCTQPGKKHRSCRYGCGRTETAVIPAAHSWEEWIVSAEPDCLTKGSRSRVCKNCGEHEVTDVPALEHDLHTDLAASCIAEGSAHCLRCGITVVLPAGAHQLHLLLDATCTTPGDQACDLCGEHVALPPKPHTWRTLRTATCHQTGQEECRVCRTKQDTPMTEHVWDAKKYVYPSCLTEGHRVCAVRACGYSEMLPALGHDWSEWQPDQKDRPVRHCLRCDAQEEGISPAQETLITLGLTMMGNEGPMAFSLRLEDGLLQLSYPAQQSRLALAITPDQYSSLEDAGVDRLVLTPGNIQLRLPAALQQDPRVARVLQAWGCIDAYVLMYDPMSGIAQFTMVRGGDMVWHEGLSQELLQ